MESFVPNEGEVARVSREIAALRARWILTKI